MSKKEKVLLNDHHTGEWEEFTNEAAAKKEMTKRVNKYKDEYASFDLIDSDLVIKSFFAEKTVKFLVKEST